MKTPKTFPIVLTAGQTRIIPIVGRFVHIRSCTVASFEAAFDDDPLETFYPGATYPSPEMFDQIRLKDSLGAGCTLELITAQVPFTDVAYDQSVLTTIATALSTLSTLQEIPDTPTAVAEATIAQTGVGQNQLITAAATTRRIMVQADYANTGAVYVGFATGVTAANAPIHLQPGDSWPEDFAGNVWASSANGTEKARAYVIKIS